MCNTSSYLKAAVYSYFCFLGSFCSCYNQILHCVSHLLHFLKFVFQFQGQAFVNDFNIGRYWPNRGPQVTLYIPAPAFNKPPERNYIYLFELESSPCFGSGSQDACFITLTDTPYLDGPNGPGIKKKLPPWHYHSKHHMVH